MNKPWFINPGLTLILTGWWFGTFCYFSIIYGENNPN